MFGDHSVPSPVFFESRCFWKVLVHRTTVDYTHQLHSSTDSQKGDVSVYCGFNQRRFGVVLVGMGQIDVLSGFLVVQGGMNVWPSCND